MQTRPPPCQALQDLGGRRGVACPRPHSSRDLELGTDPGPFPNFSTATWGRVFWQAFFLTANDTFEFSGLMAIGG